MPFDDVDSHAPRHRPQPYALGALASRVTYVAGNAVKRAAAARADAAARRRAAPARTAGRQSWRSTTAQIGVRGAAGGRFAGRSAAVVRAQSSTSRTAQPIIGVGTFDNPSEFPDHSPLRQRVGRVQLRRRRPPRSRSIRTPAKSRCSKSPARSTAAPSSTRRRRRPGRRAPSTQGLGLAAHRMLRLGQRRADRPNLRTTSCRRSPTCRSCTSRSPTPTSRRARSARRASARSGSTRCRPPSPTRSPTPWACASTTADHRGENLSRAAPGIVRG